MYKLSFCYFYHDEIYLLYENSHEFSLEGLHKMIAEMENHKFQVKRVTHLKSHRHNYTSLLCYLHPSWNSVTSLV